MRFLRRDADGEFYHHISFGVDIPPYAVLSHTWNNEELSVQDIHQGTNKHTQGFRKLTSFWKLAQADGLEYIWLDTCCVDKSSDAEMTEAINSVFTLFRNAAKCYVSLSDVVFGDRFTKWEEAFTSSRWFTRSLTLQELLAPPSMEFYDLWQHHLGSKKDLESLIHTATGIDRSALQGTPLSEFSNEKKFSWSVNRSASRPEDEAYALLGIFDIAMPLLYGEGREKAFRRLNQELQNSERDGTFDHSPGVVYSTRLPKHAFRIFVLDSGAIGSRITGRLQQWDFSKAPAYIALSYVWGQEPPIHPIVVNGVTRFIPPNLFHALQRIRPERGLEYLWVDSLCINQADEIERTIQVQQMSRIYRNASGVTVWLGEDDSTSQFAMDLIPELMQPDYKWQGLWWEQFSFMALGRLMERSWFRRGWVLQEAAFSRNTTVLCGNRQVHMSHLTRAIEMVKIHVDEALSKWSAIETSLPIQDTLHQFIDSPAISLLDTLSMAFTRSEDGRILDFVFSLEAVVERVKFSETTDQRDAIYAMLSLATETQMVSSTDTASSHDIAGELQNLAITGSRNTPFSEVDAGNQTILADNSSIGSSTRLTERIIPDYQKTTLEVFQEFVLHCCHQSNSLDVICRPWAPVSHGVNNSQGFHVTGQLDRRSCPSWIACRENLPFGDPSSGSRHRVHGNVLVGSCTSRSYNAHGNTKPRVNIHRIDHGVLSHAPDYVLSATGLTIGTIDNLSTRMAQGIITRECLDILGTTTWEKRGYNAVGIPEEAWRTLCANRDANGKIPSYDFGTSFEWAIQEMVTRRSGEEIILRSLDIEYLLEARQLSNDQAQALKRVRDVVWNRCVFNSTGRVTTITGETLWAKAIGLAPQKSQIGDHVCLLYGCSVPVVLRPVHSDDHRQRWTLIGEAYVHDYMDGEAFNKINTAPEQIFHIQ